MSSRLKSIIVLVAGLNILAATLLFAAREYGAAMLVAGLVAYGLGMRHAFDADHIAAIDNVTRRMRHLGRRPVAVGFFFSLGHSSVVLLLVLALALSFGGLAPELQALTRWGSVVSNLFSAAILTAVGLANLAVLRELIGRPASRPAAPAVPPFLRPWLAKALTGIDSSVRMFPVGMLFGLGFDTATEVALLAISAGAVQSGHFPLWAVMSLPLLFAAGMCFMDTLQSLVMLRVYDWAIADGNRSLKLNTAVTTVSVLLALGIAGLRWRGLLNLVGAQKLFTTHVDLAGSGLVGLLASVILVSLWMAARLRRRQRAARAAA